MAKVGTLAWSRKTGGRLGFFDRMELMRQAMRLRAIRRKQQGLVHAAFPLDQRDLVAPDSPAAKRALAVAESLSEPYLLNHCYRTFFWGSLLARADNVRFDAELLFVASILHDLGLTVAHAHGAAGEKCFAVTGARCAREAMTPVQWNSRRLDALEEAITLHLNLIVPVDRHGTEASLLHAGAGLDVVGARLPEIRGPAVDAVLHQHPRLDYKVRFQGVVDNQCSIRPNSRIAFLSKNGFSRLLEAAPFAS
jgi:hypothetical protein